jgi:hypothetical protein
MKSQAKKAITLSGGAAMLVLAVGFGGGDPLTPGASAPVIASAVGGADLPGQAHPDDPPCVAEPTDPCPPPMDVSANVPSRPQPQTMSTPRTQVFCQPAGAVGAFCYRRIVP